jgi:hypothetical protein
VKSKAVGHGSRSHRWTSWPRRGPVEASLKIVSSPPKETDSSKLPFDRRGGSLVWSA